MNPALIILNAGSSSLKFQLFEQLENEGPRLIWRGFFDGIGGSTHFVVRDASGTGLDERFWEPQVEFSHEDALMHLVAWLREESTRVGFDRDRSPCCPWRRDFR